MKDVKLMTTDELRTARVKVKNQLFPFLYGTPAVEVPKGLSDRMAEITQELRGRVTTTNSIPGRN
jgi:hypothetical protein